MKAYIISQDMVQIENTVFDIKYRRQFTTPNYPDYAITVEVPDCSLKSAKEAVKEVYNRKMIGNNYENSELLKEERR